METDEKVFTDALWHCFGLGSGIYLAWPETKQELCDIAHLVDQVSSTDIAWIGASNVLGTYKWMWTDAASALFFGRQGIALYLHFGY